MPLPYYFSDLLRYCIHECAATFPSPTAFVYWYGLPVQSPAAKQPATFVCWALSTNICPFSISSCGISFDGAMAFLRQNTPSTLSVFPLRSVIPSTNESPINAIGASFDIFTFGSSISLSL